jgi:hypothetical protein
LEVTHSQVNSKTVEELETMISSFDNKMRNEVNEYLQACHTEIEAIIDELTAREINEVKAKYSSQRQAIEAELNRRQ